MSLPKRDGEFVAVAVSTASHVADIRFDITTKVDLSGKKELGSKLVANSSTPGGEGLCASQSYSSVLGSEELFPQYLLRLIGVSVFKLLLAPLGNDRQHFGLQ